MQGTKGLLNRIKHHDKVPITVNQNCAIALPEEVWRKLLQPHKLAYYYFGPGYTQTDFTKYQGTSTVEEAGRRIVKYALIG